MTLHHIFDNDGNRLSIDTLLKQNPERWKASLSNEIGRLAQGIRNVKGNDVVDFVSISEVPRNKKVAYANMVYYHRPLKQKNVESD